MKTKNEILARALAIKMIDRVDLLAKKQNKTVAEQREFNRLMEMKKLVLEKAVN